MRKSIIVLVVALLGAPGFVIAQGTDWGYPQQITLYNYSQDTLDVGIAVQFDTTKWVVGICDTQVTYVDSSLLVRPFVKHPMDSVQVPALLFAYTRNQATNDTFVVHGWGSKNILDVGIPADTVALTDTFVVNNAGKSNALDSLLATRNQFIFFYIDSVVCLNGDGAGVDSLVILGQPVNAVKLADSAEVNPVGVVAKSSPTDSTVIVTWRGPAQARFSRGATVNWGDYVEVGRNGKITLRTSFTKLDTAIFIAATSVTKTITGASVGDPVIVQLNRGIIGASKDSVHYEAKVTAANTVTISAVAAMTGGLSNARTDTVSIMVGNRGYDPRTVLGMVIGPPYSGNASVTDSSVHYIYVRP